MRVVGEGGGGRGGVMGGGGRASWGSSEGELGIEEGRTECDCLSERSNKLSLNDDQHKSKPYCIIAW